MKNSKRGASVVKKDVSPPAKGKRNEPVKVDVPVVADVKKVDTTLKKT